MITRFFLVCKKCFQKEKSWEGSTVCNIHNDNGIITFTCFNCGAEETFKPEQVNKTTKRQALLHREREKLKQELEEKIN